MAVGAEATKHSQDLDVEALDPARLAKKRRRKTQSNGAIEDCFACQKRQSLCDRRRPYCSQCLEVGKECSGYKTVLTWGVGVASRGKLRGMSTPVTVPGAKPAGNIADTAQRRRTSSITNNLDTQSLAKVSSAQAKATVRKRSTSTSIKSEFSESVYSFVPATTSNSIPEERTPSSQQTHGQLPPLRTLVDHEGHHMHEPPRLHSPFWAGHELHSPDHRNNSLDINGSMSSYSDNSYEHTFGSASSVSGMSLQNPFSTTFDHRRFPSTQSLQPSAHMPTKDLFGYKVEPDQNQDDLIDPQFSTSSTYDEPMLLTPSVNEVRSFLETQDSSQLVSFGDMDCDPSEVSNVAGHESQFARLGPMSQQLPSPSYALPLYHLAPRMQYLLKYYDEKICPILVAIDGPTNPYRVFMMQLASQNVGLQSAIAALVTNNMRMKTAKIIPRLKQESAMWEIDDNDGVGPNVDGPSAEEQMYKTRSIEHLNAQLTSPIKARDNSVLATLLILCLFHVCDSGFSKFKTQLAGVQKLLRMRGQVFHSDFVGWVEMFFAWFDVMTSTVNDREIQVHGDSLDLMNLNANFGALEQFCGCDGRLFKLIARLGRLNLLSQNRAVYDSSSDMTPRASPQLQGSRAMSPVDLYNLQDEVMAGNVQSNQSTSPCRKSSDAYHTSSTSPPPSHAFPDPDGRSEFWSEWHDVRNRLHEWQSDAFYLTITPDELPLDQRDLIHISEAFRYSALLYIERLAFPDLPPSSRNLQEHVVQSLYHIAAIGLESCATKFLLWPLFITGTECVEEAQRDMIRERCVEIQKESGFYNNINGLIVLGKVWKEIDEEMSRKGSEDGIVGVTGRQAFRWRTAMDRVDGEYIMI